MDELPVRRDRKYFVSLGLHNAVRAHLHVDPDRVLALGMQGGLQVRPNTGGEARDLTDVWIELLSKRDLLAIDAVLTGTDEVSVEMRNLAIFMGVLSLSERRHVLDEVYERAEYTD